MMTSPRFFQPAELGLDLGDGNSCRVVQIDPGGAEPLGRLSQPGPFLSVPGARCGACRWQSGIGAEHPGYQLGVGHFREKMATSTSFFMATLAAMFSAKEDFPIPGRAATKIRSDLLSPESRASRPVKPEGRPGVAAVAFGVHLVDLVVDPDDDVADGFQVRRLPPLADIVDLLFCGIQKGGGVAVRLPDGGGDIRSRSQKVCAGNTSPPRSRSSGRGFA